ncbi:uncharacterized protein RJT21DRAFT_48174 [Scheffersomyces amazonensis]|uniref:uncharacterized protein n=1 Tax=Scheffersomyces amazonensis TaxID=1078765 RepID=UPI00315DD596
MTSVSQILSLDIGHEDKILQLGELDLTNIEEHLSGADDLYKIILLLLKLESIISTTLDIPQIEKILGTIQSNPTLKRITNTGYSTTDTIALFIRIKYNDLLTDYQYLIDDPKYSKFIELVNKKVLIINNIPTAKSTESKLFPKLIELIQLKILQLYHISSYDLKKPSVLKYLTEDLQGKLDGQLSQVVELYKLGKIIPPSIFHEILTLNYGNNYNRIVTTHLDHQKLLKNSIENNIVSLTKYYQSIRIEKMYEILKIPREIDVEEIIFNMIIHNTFPSAVKIDQIEGLVRFHDQTDESQIVNNHIQEVSKIINDISVQLPV